MVERNEKKKNPVIGNHFQCGDLRSELGVLCCGGLPMRFQHLGGGDRRISSSRLSLGYIGSSPGTLEIERVWREGGGMEEEGREGEGRETEIKREKERERFKN